MAERIFERFEHSSLHVEVSQIIIHKTDQPDVVVHFFDADGLTSENRAEVDFFLARADAAAAGDHDGFVMEGINAPKPRPKSRVLGAYFADGNL